MSTSDTRDWTGHVIVCGMQGLGVRVVELLQSAGIRVVVVGSQGEDHHLRTLKALGAPRIFGSPRNPERLWEAGLEGALAVVCVEDDDLKCLESALLVQELMPQMRVIVRQSNPAVGRAVTSVISRGLVVNPADLAAPTFVESVLDERMHRMPIGGGSYAVAEVEVTGSGRLQDMFRDLAPILLTRADGTKVICPSREVDVQPGDQVALVGREDEFADLGDMPARRLGRPASGPRPVRHPLKALGRSLAYGANSGLKWTVVALALLGVAFTLLLAVGFVDSEPMT